MGRRACILALTILTCSCASASLPLDLPTHWYIRPVEVTQVPDWYRDAYDAARACAGDAARAESYDAIRWRVVQAIFRLDEEGEASLARGQWTHPHFIALDRLYVDEWETVSHELLHEVLGANYPHEHPLFAWCRDAVTMHDPR